MAATARRSAAEVGGATGVLARTQRRTSSSGSPSSLREQVPSSASGLTVARKSAHLDFHYRPGSYADRHIERIIDRREKAYERLSTILKMELPKRIRIDLYPDMRAKGLGSGTKWTPANTVNNAHIAEVHSETNKTDPHHELAHIFSYYFPAHPGDNLESA